MALVKVTNIPLEVESTLQTLKVGKASGPNGLNNRILRELSSQLASPFCSLFNQSLRLGIMPASYKEANVCPVPKKGDAGLLYKLEVAGVTGEVLNWFKSYLSDRRQRVILPGVSSVWNFIRAGVPQGSILGPLLFLLFINDIVNGIDSNIRLFADDTSLFIIVDNAP